MSRLPVYRVLTTDGRTRENLTLEEVLPLLQEGEVNVWPMGYQEREDKDE
jgi:hypothetical protein